MDEARLVPGLTPPPPTDADFLVIARGLDVMVEEIDGSLRLPTRATVRHLADTLIYLGTRADRAWYGAALAPDLDVPAGLRFASVRTLFALLDTETLGALGFATAIVEWDTMHRVCGRCAAPTQVLAHERARSCPRCEAVFYPRVAPAVIVLIEDRDRILLARGPNGPPGMFGAIAGFVETGESLEEAVVREVREEVGIEISNLRYFESQPWPFGRSLLVGFFATYTGGELRPDPREIVEAGWFSPENLPTLPPKLSIARRLIDAFIARAP